MSDATFRSTPAPEPMAVTVIDPAHASRRRWMSAWRVHIYAGLFGIPFILTMALTGLVILYTQPIQDLAQGDLRTVADGGEWISFDDQAMAVEAAFPDAAVTSMTLPRDAEHSTIFAVDDGSESGLEVFVNPYTAEVLGSTPTGGDLVGFANRVHGTLNNEAVVVSLPTVSALWDGDAVMREYVVGDLVLEILGVWTLVLVASGLYLRWPRRAPGGTQKTSWRRFFGLEIASKGRARWRDLHAISGVFLSLLLLLTLISGLAWSTYWGPTFASVADLITPNTWTDAPASSEVVRGDLDRFGNQIPWNTADAPIPASYAPPADGSAAAPVSLDAVVAVAGEEGMLAGYTIAFPTNTEDEAGNLVHGAFTASNSWPRKTEEARSLHIDQFSAQTLGEESVYGYGAVSRGMDTLVSTHMGTQLGIVSRIGMTLMCIFAIWSVLSALVMYRKRRKPGSTGLPRRQPEGRTAKRFGVFAVGTAIVFPTWGVSALAILGIDRLVDRVLARRSVATPAAAA